MIRHRRPSGSAKSPRTHEFKVPTRTEAVLKELTMQQRIVLAVVLSALILVGYSYFFPPPPPPAVDDTAEPAAEAEAEVAEREVTEVVERAPEPEPLAPVVERVEHRLQNDLLALTVDNQPGGLITEVEPLDEQFRDRATGAGIDFLLLAGEGRTLEAGFVAGETGFAWSRVPAAVRAKDSRSIELVRRQGDVELVETLTLLDGYEARYEIVVRNHGAGEQLHRLELVTRMGLGVKQSRYDVHRALCRTPEDLEDFDYDDVKKERETVKGGLDWFALDSKYFLQAVVPGERLSGCVVSSDEAGTALINAAIGRETKLGPGEQKRYVFGLYIGAKVDTMLGGFPTSPELREMVPPTDLNETVDWGWFGRLSKLIGGMMLDLLRWFYALTGIWGVAIIMLTVVIKAVLLPLTIKQYASMRKMKELQPEIEKIRTKYKDDKVKQQQEMQALFGRMGVSPLAGCAPMLLQFPVWIALYAMLGAVVDLFNEPFLWLPDLTQPDPFYILPIAMGGLMVIQTRMNPSTGDQAQMKMMMWLMPGVFVVMMLFLPSGLGVYIFANIVLSLIQSFIQLRIKSKDGKDGPAQAAGSDPGGEGAKGAKGAKAKGAKAGKD
jgi:YidC/Oxa1 family membrane protein insertase